MTSRPSYCDVCLGTSFEPFPGAARAGRELVRCRDCGLVAASGAGLESRGAALLRRDERSDSRRAAAVMRLLPSGRVLEIGCAGGHFLAGLHPERYQVVGVEPDGERAAAASRRIRNAGLRGEILQETKIAPLVSESFDLIAMFGTLGRCSSPRATLTELCRLLQNGGYAVIETPSLASLTARLLGPRWRPLREPGAGYFFTPAILDRLTSSCGFLPGSIRLPMLSGWPSPGTIVYLARKSCEPRKVSPLSDLVGSVPSIDPLGATH